MNVQEYWQKLIALGLDPFVFISLITLRGIEQLCPFLNGITPIERDQTDQSQKWLDLATALGIDVAKIVRNRNGGIDLGIQLKSQGSIDGRILNEFISFPREPKWHAEWVATTDASGEPRDRRLEIRQGPATEGSTALSGAQFGEILRALAGLEDSPTGVRLNFPNIWRNPSDPATGQSDTANILLYVPSSQYPLFKNESTVTFANKGGQAFVNTAGVPSK